MGTNYYVDDPIPCCPTCGRRSDVYHIGKSSMGSAFLFRGYRDDSLTSAKAWFEYLAGKGIVDEYGRKHSLEDFRRLVESKRGGRIHPSHNKEIDADGHPVSFYEFS
jgi:hypothetical protein